MHKIPHPLIAVLNYRRADALRKFLASLKAHCPGRKVAVFEDCANFDGAGRYLAQGTFLGRDAELEANVWDHPDGFIAHLGTRNLGVAGNSNRAIRWFERDASSNHLLLCNDDLVATGDFTETYRKAHEKLGVGLFCFNDFTSEEYRPVVVTSRGQKVHIATRMTGIMMSITRALVRDIGYYGIEFGQWGQEHVDYTHRARLTGHLNVGGKPQHCLDVPCPELHHQEVASSIFPFERGPLDSKSWNAIQRAGYRYRTEGHYRPFRTRHGELAGAYDRCGIPVSLLERMGYEVVVDPAACLT